jgi:hypothetical protein
VPLRDREFRRDRSLSSLRRAFDAERRVGPAFNRRAVGLYEWLFIIIGPTALAFGCFAVAQGAWIGGLLVVLGLWWTIIGFRRLVRWIEKDRRRPSSRGDDILRPAAVESSASELRQLGSRRVRLLGGAVLIVAGVLIIVLALVR